MEGRIQEIARSNKPHRILAAYDGLQVSAAFIASYAVQSFSLASLARYENLLRMKTAVGKDDLRTAAIALEAGGMVVTRNLSDFRRVPGWFAKIGPPEPLEMSNDGLRTGKMVERRVEVVTARMPMQIPVLVEPMPNGGGFRAKTGEPFSVSAESTDRNGAIDEVRKKLDEMIVAGQVVPVNVGGSNPMAKLIGTIDMKDPEMQKWWQYVQEFRSEMDQMRLGDEPAENEP